MRLCTAGALALMAAAAPVLAEGYPERGVSMVVAFSAGGATDHMARLLAQRMSELWRQPVVVLNRPGAGGNIGAESVVRAAPDGYTLLVGTTALAISPSLYKKLGYDVLKDLAPVTQLTVTPNVLVVHPSLPVKSVKDLVALARARPGQVNFAGSGSGSTPHLAAELFNMTTGVKTHHVPYKGGGPALTDLVRGEVQMHFAVIISALPHIQSKRLKPLAIGGVAVGADGVMVEVHPRPDEALSDAEQQLTLEQFRDMMASLTAIHDHVRGMHGDPVEATAALGLGAGLSKH